MFFYFKKTVKRKAQCNIFNNRKYIIYMYSGIVEKIHKISDN